MGVLLRWPPLILWAAAHLLLQDCAGSTSHSLRYFFTAVSEPGQGLPQFIAVGYVDGQQFVQYDSDTKKMLPRVPWIRKVEKEDPQYWHRNTQRSQGNELVFRRNLQTLWNRYNQSGEAPVVKVTRKGDYDSQETLVCQVHGFYPKEIDANWVKDGEVWQEGTSRGLVAPNSDGTYYVLLSVKTDPKERDRFRCRVEHDSLEKPLDVAWEKPVNLGLIVRAILGIVAAILLVSVIIFFIRRKRSEKLAYKEASTSDQGSASSTRASDQPSV
nr:class I histocompatibility antigen, Gogo-B*0101 alpha chain-like isoform X3 [Zootoca vivipara]